MDKVKLLKCYIKRVKNSDLQIGNLPDAISYLCRTKWLVIYLVEYGNQKSVYFRDCYEYSQAKKYFKNPLLYFGESIRSFNEMTFFWKSYPEVKKWFIETKLVESW